MPFVSLPCPILNLIVQGRQETNTFSSSGVSRNFVRVGGVRQIQLKSEGREIGDLGAVAPTVRGSTQFANEWHRIVMRLLWMYIPRNWEFGSALAKLRNFGRAGGGGCWTHQTPSTLSTSLFSSSYLAVYSLPVTWHTDSLTSNNCPLCPHCVYVFCVCVRTNSDLCHL
jgi:hypothetical protein